MQKKKPAIQEFREAFKDQFFPPGTTAFYRQSPNGALGVSIIQNTNIMHLKFKSLTHLE
jgi:chalcone isomerase